MRDSFDNYFSGWNLDPDEPAQVQAEFAVLVAAVGRYVTDNPTAAEAWHLYPLDGKKECFFYFTKMARDAGVLPASTQSLVTHLKTHYPRSFG